MDYDADGDLDLITTDFQNPDGNHHSLPTIARAFYRKHLGGLFRPLHLRRSFLYLGLLNDDAYPDLFILEIFRNRMICCFTLTPEALGFPSCQTGAMVSPNPFENQIEVSLSRALPNVEELLLFQLYGVDGSLLVQQEISPWWHYCPPGILDGGVYAYHRLSGSWGFQTKWIALRR